MWEKLHHSKRTQALNLIGPHKPVLGCVSIMEPITDTRGEALTGLLWAPMFQSKSLGQSQPHLKPEAPDGEVDAGCQQRSSSYIWKCELPAERAGDGQRAAPGCQEEDWNIPSGLLVPEKLGSSLPVRAMSGQGVGTLLHLDAHAPIPELTDAMLVWCRTAKCLLWAPLALGAPCHQQWRAPDFALAGRALATLGLGSRRKTQAGRDSRCRLVEMQARRGTHPLLLLPVWVPAAGTGGSLERNFLNSR